MRDLLRLLLLFGPALAGYGAWEYRMRLLAARMGVTPARLHSDPAPEFAHWRKVHGAAVALWAVPLQLLAWALVVWAF